MPAARLAVVVQSFQLWRLPLSLVTLDDRSGDLIEDERTHSRLALEVEHVIERICIPVDGSRTCGRSNWAIDEAELPIVFDETKHRGLVSQRVIDEVRFRPGRNHQQRLARAEAAARGVGTGLRRAAIAGAEQEVDVGRRRGQERRHDVVVPAIGIIPNDDDRSVVPIARLLDRVDCLYEEGLFGERIGVLGMAVLIDRRLHVTDRGQ